MRISPPALVVYGGCTFDKALDIVWNRRLRECEPEPRPVTGIWFYDEQDLVLFTLLFHEEVEFEDHLAIVFPGQQHVVEAFIAEYELESQIKRFNLLAVRHWDTDDQTAFEQELQSRSH